MYNNQCAVQAEDKLTAAATGASAQEHSPLRQATGLPAENACWSGMSISVVQANCSI